MVLYGLFWCSIIRETRHILPPCNKPRISKFHLEFQNIFELLLLLQSLWDISEYFHQENLNIIIVQSRHFESPPRIFQELKDSRVSVTHYYSYRSLWVILIFLPQKQGSLCHPIIKLEFQKFVGCGYDIYQNSQFMMRSFLRPSAQLVSSFLYTMILTLKVLVGTIDTQWKGMGDVGSARYEPALLPPCPTIRVLSYSN